MKITRSLFLTPNKERSIPRLKDGIATKNVLVPINTLVAETTDEDLESVDIVPGNILASPVASEVSVEVKGLVAAEADSFEIGRAHV